MAKATPRSRARICGCRNLLQARRCIAPAQRSIPLAARRRRWHGRAGFFPSPVAPCWAACSPPRRSAPCAADAGAPLTITWGEDDNAARTYDPRVTSSRHEEQVIGQVFDTLIASDGSNKLFPGLATSWETAPDGKQRHAEAAPGRAVPRRHAVRRRGGEVHLRHDRRSEARQRGRRHPARPLCRCEVHLAFQVQVKYSQPVRRRGRAAMPKDAGAGVAHGGEEARRPRLLARAGGRRAVPLRLLGRTGGRWCWSGSSL